MTDLAVKHVCPAYRYARRMESMGDRIKRLRQAQGMTQEALGKACGVSKQAVSQWESGLTANIRLEGFLELLEALHTDAEYLIWGPSRSRPGTAPKRNRI